MSLVLTAIVVAAGVTEPRAQSMSPSDVELKLNGRWTATSGTNPRTFQLIVKGVRENAGVFDLLADWGFSDGRPAPLKDAKIRIENGALVVEFVTTTKAQIVATVADDSNMKGTLTNEAGQSFPLKVVLNERSPVSVASAPAEPKAAPKAATAPKAASVPVEPKAEPKAKSAPTAKIETGPGLPGQKCADGTAPDNVTRIFGGGLCLASHTTLPSRPAEAAPIVVFLHADGGGRTGEAYWKRISANAVSKLQVIGVSVLRPGYSDGKVKSEGYARPTDDDYRRPTIDVVAGILDSLRAYYPGRKLVLTGHSGGAAISALVMGIHPGKADAAVIVGCPCDVTPWRHWRNSTTGRSGDSSWSSLSPLSYASGVAKTAPVIAVTGEKDDNTLPKFAQAYIEAVKKNGNEHSDYVIAPGATHGNSPDSPSYQQAVAKVIGLIGAPAAVSSR